MTKAQSTGRRLRRIILVGGIVYVLVALGWMLAPYLNGLDIVDFEFFGLLLTPLLAPGCFGDCPDGVGYPVNIVIVIGLVLIAQWAFLRPAHGWTIRVTTIGRPLKTAVLSAAIMAALLTTGLVALVLEIGDWWEPVIEEKWNIFYIWGAMLVVWGAWAWIFFAYWRQGDRYTQMGKMVRGLVTGSILEVLVSVPVHVWAMQQRDCYCCRGTYTTLILAGTVLLWAFGPGIVLLYMREKYRQQRLLPVCFQCGYDLRGTLSAGRVECPECGEPVSPRLKELHAGSPPRGEAA